MHIKILTSSLPHPTPKSLELFQILISGQMLNHRTKIPLNFLKEVIPVSSRLSSSALGFLYLLFYLSFLFFIN